ncbi:phage tail sheath subtilisin-like domain-containing protein [Candidatus Williamhamiltonella defendens]|uniref:Phage tail protein n=1 Tax=Candidatus Williamhamiltonella defendens TaxID=138072 RepID=A0A2D3TC83_9ENTR|nr:phage tail sheath subtilisin-like domain-containing protein [Candidatus Hamiltonella defensa]ATW33141.1 phage tail protein [Candidatus Hamiltonella defensa]
MIPFQNVPGNLRTPLFFAEVDNSQANTATVNQNTLIVGQMLKTGTATADKSVICSSSANAKVLCGQGSMLAAMMDVYLQNDSSGTIYLLPLADAAAGMTGADGKLTITGVPTANGVISLYIAGLRVQVAVVPTDTSADIGGAIVTAISANADLPVTAELVTGEEGDPIQVKLKAKNLGALGNTIDIRLNYLGASGGEYSPPGVDIAIVKMTGGVGSPDLSAALASLHDTNYDFIVFPYDDTTSLDAVRDFLNDQTGRWSYSQQTYGHAFGATSGTYGVLTSKGEGRNDQHASLMGMNDSPSPSYAWSAGYAGASAVSLRNDPGRPLQTLVVRGVLAPPMTSCFSLTERNTLLYSGISTFTVQTNGSVQIENVITTYHLNGYGQPDDSYLQVETLFLLMFCMRDMRSIVTSKFGRVKLAKDGTRFAPGSALVTPSTIKAELIAEYQSLEWQGYVQDSKGFAAGLMVEQNAKNPSRVDVLWDGVLMNQLRIFAVLAQFRLQPSS